MKKILSLVLALALLLSCCAFAEEETAEPKLTKDLYVLFTSDVHCGISEGFGYIGLAAVRDSLKANNNVLLVDNGDSIQGEPVGTMTTGEANIKLMNTIGYDVATLGNHEFDYGMDRLFELIGMADFPYVSSTFNKNGELVLPAYVIKEVEGLKIAFVGVSTPKTLTTSTPAYFMDENGNFIYGFFQSDSGEEFYAAVQSAVDAARAEGVDYVVAMAHLGNETEAIPYTYADLISNTNGIDVLLDGHSHDKDQVEMLNKDGETVLRSACGTKLEGIGYLKIAAEDLSLSTGLYTWNADVAAPELFGLSNYMTDAITEATAELDTALSEVIGTTAVDLIIKDPETGERVVRNQETNLGDLCADAYRFASGADVAIVNGGGIRDKISAGDITRNQVLTVHPFGNAMCVCEVTGQEILDALELSVHSWPGEFGGWLQVSGMTFEIHTYIESGVQLDENDMFVGVDGEYRVKNVMIGDEPLDPEKTYTLASHNYKLKNKGDGYTMFADNVFTQNEVMLDNQVLINYIQNGLGGTVGEEYSDIWGQGRIVFVTEKPAE